MNKIKLAVLTFAVLIGVAVLTPVHSVSADNKTEVLKGVNSVGGAQNTKSLNTTIRDVVNVMLYIIGVLSVIMIVFGGIRYVISAGDSTKVAAAKNTVLYSVVGLVVALLSYAIVNFVLTNL
ncbi:MAG: pilin [Candidatus Saccharimonadales bacterium]